MVACKKKKLFLVVSEDWSFWSHRLPLALSAIDAGYEVTLYTKINQLEEKINAKGIKVVNINFGRSSKSPITDLLNIIILARIIKKEKPDIIHNVALKTIFISSIAAVFTKNTVVVNAFTGLGYVFSSDHLQAKVIRLFIKPLFRLLLWKEYFWTIFQNPDDMELFKELKLSSVDRSVLIRGSGVDTREFSQKDDLNEIPVVMLASRILWDKGVGEFVEVARRMIRNNIEAKFILVGDVDVANPMSIPVSTLKEWTREGFISWQGHSDNMPETLGLASIVCLPSYREGLPKILLEAAAVGRPLIATDVPGCREIVKNGENGILVKLKDVESLYQAIKTLVSNKEMRLKMGKNGRNLVESQFSTNIINGQTLELYNIACNSIIIK